ncbi:MAG: ATP-binding protein, partial [Nanoarchaeota archaeon]
MKKEELLEILEDWNFWNKDLDVGKERNLYVKKCLDFLKTNVIIDIIGIRRAGKSYAMRQVIKKLIEKKINRKNILMINFEDRRFTDFYPKLIDEIYETYLEFLKPDKQKFVFLDEVHNLPNWEKWARTMHELGKAKIVVSGSSSKLLSGELATLLTGRHLDIFMFPLSFKEFLDFKGLNVKDKLELLRNKIKIKGFLGEYLGFGGFPEAILSKDKKQLLLTLFEDIITKDIEKRYDVKEKTKLRALAKFYLTNISNTITFNSLKNYLNTTTKTIEKFSSYLEEANMLFFTKRFSYKFKEQEKSPRKIYAMDVGLANAIGFKFSSNIGRIAENIVAIELRRKEKSELNLEVYYWKNPQHEEVDFAIKEGLKMKKLI